MSDEARELRDRIEELQVELREHKREVEKLKGDSKKDDRADLKWELDEVWKERDKLLAQLEEIRGTVREREVRIGQTESELGTARSEQRRLLSQLEDLKLELRATLEDRRKLSLRVEALTRGPGRASGGQSLTRFQLATVATLGAAVVVLLLALLWHL